MSFTLVTACREALSGVVSTRLIREQEEEDRKTKAYEEVSPSRLLSGPIQSGPVRTAECRQRG